MAPEVRGANDSFDSLLADAIGERYVLNGRIADGAMATVYRARDLRHARAVAIKVLAPEVASAIGRERFTREIEMLGRLQHPNILPLIDSGEAGGRLFYIAPLIAGGTLRDRLSSEGMFPVAEALSLTIEVARALGYAHRQGVVHRDVKPENVLLADGHALLADFGVARAHDESAALTATGMTLGTPMYMSPEQATGLSGSADGRSDMYSLGCVLYELLAGEPPFTGPNARVVMARHAIDPVPSLEILRPGVPAGIQFALQRSLAKLPADRFRTMDEFAEALETPDTLETVGGGPRPRGRRVVRSRLLLALSAGAVLILLGAGAWALQHASQQNAPVAIPVQLTVTGMVESPRWSPDGRRLAVVRTDTEHQSIWIRDLGSGAFTKVFEGSAGHGFNLAGWTGDGRSLIVEEWPLRDGLPRADSAWAFRVRLNDGVRDPLQSLGSAAHSWSGERFVGLQLGKDSSHLLVSDPRLARFDRVPVPLTLPGVHPPPMVSLSPDGHRVATLLRTGDDRDLLVLLDARTGQPDTLHVAEPGQQLGFPQWVGSRNVYVHTQRPGDATFSLVSFDVDGDRQPVVVRNDLANEGIISPQGLQAAFIRGARLHTLRLFGLPTAGTAPGVSRNFAGGELGMATISPDGEMLVAVEPDSSGETLVLQSVTNGSRRTVLTGARQLGLPEWSADGMRIAVRELPQEGFVRLAVVNVRDGSILRIAHGDSIRGILPGRLAWAPDGTTLYVVTQSDGVLRSLPIDHPESARVLHDPRGPNPGARFSHVVASPDGRFVALSGQGLVIIDLRSGVRRVVVGQEAGPPAKYIASVSTRVLGWHVDGRIFFTRGADGRVLEMRVTDRRPRTVVDFESVCEVSRASITSDARQLLCVNTTHKSDLFIVDLPRTLRN